MAGKGTKREKKDGWSVDGPLYCNAGYCIAYGCNERDGEAALEKELFPCETNDLSRSTRTHGLSFVNEFSVGRSFWSGNRRPSELPGQTFSSPVQVET